MIAGPATCFAKAAVFLLHRRIFALITWIRRCIHVGLALLLVVYWCAIPLYTYACAAHDGVWGTNVMQQCGQVWNYIIALRAFDTAMSVYTLLLPIPAVMGLQMSIKKKVGIIFIFMHGIFALVGSVAALYYTIRLTQGGDELFYQTTIILCVTVENDMTIISSSMHPIAAYLKEQEGLFEFFASLRSQYTWTFSLSRHEAPDTSPSGPSTPQNNPFRNAILFQEWDSWFAYSRRKGFEDQAWDAELAAVGRASV